MHKQIIIDNVAACDAFTGGKRNFIFYAFTDRGALLNPVLREAKRGELSSVDDDEILLCLGKVIIINNVTEV